MTPSYESAFDKLVDVSMKQTELMTEQVILLRGLAEKLGDVAEKHAESVRETRTYIKDIVTTTVSSSDLWWKRATIALGLLLLFGQLIGGAAADGLLFKLLGVGK